MEPFATEHIYTDGGPMWENCFWTYFKNFVLSNFCIGFPKSRRLLRNRLNICFDTEPRLNIQLVLENRSHKILPLKKIKLRHFLQQQFIRRSGHLGCKGFHPNTRFQFARLSDMQWQIWWSAFRSVLILSWRICEYFVFLNGWSKCFNRKT